MTRLAMSSVRRRIRTIATSPTITRTARISATIGSMSHSFSKPLNISAPATTATAPCPSSTAHCLAALASSGRSSGSAGLSSSRSVSAAAASA
ncbi:hypothetical protein GS531_15405 [Rhodococcus hoagii]|nr:hypothetical protein [Prescottella equi]